MKGKLIKGKNSGEYVINLEGVVYVTIYESTFPHKLSLKNCQAIERGYDLDELGKECSENASEVDIPYSNGLYYGFIKGFQIAMEILGDKKFSEEDMKIAIEIARNGSMQEQHNGYGRPTESRFVLDNLPSDEIIQSLQQTEWDVSFNLDEKDENGCLILKRIDDE